MSDMIQSGFISSLNMVRIVIWSRLNQKFAEKQLSQKTIENIILKSVRLCNNDNAVLITLSLENKYPSYPIVIDNLHMKVAINDIDYQGLYHSSLNIGSLEELTIQYLIPTGKIERKGDIKLQVQSYDFDLSLGLASKHVHKVVQGHTNWAKSVH